MGEADKDLQLANLLLIRSLALAGHAHVRALENISASASRGLPQATRRVEMKLNTTPMRCKLSTYLWVGALVTRIFHYGDKC